MGRNNPPGDSEPQRGRDVRVCVRKRPFFQHEKEQGEYDVITTGGREVVIHDARMHSDMRHMFINHHSFGFDAVFGEVGPRISLSLSLFHLSLSLSLTHTHFLSLSLSLSLSPKA